MDASITLDVVKGKIYLVRGHKVLIDSDLAEMYGVETKNLNKAVKRNLSRFPNDFMFQLTAEETTALRFQNGTSKQLGKGGRRYNPYVFTEQGVAMLSSILNSDQAVQVNIAIMRIFVQMREIAISNRALTRRLDELENKYDSQFGVVFDAIRAMMKPETKKMKKIGFNK